MRLLNYVLKRLLYSIPVLIGVTLLVFIISHAIPGDPARMMAGQKASREAFCPAILRAGSPGMAWEMTKTSSVTPIRTGMEYRSRFRT